MLKYHYKPIEYLGNHPKEHSPSWTENAQGVTHDEDHWYITQNYQSPVHKVATFGMGKQLRPRLWKIPITHNLADDPPGGYVTMPDELLSEGLNSVAYDHFGDLDRYEEFLFIAVTGRGGRPPLAVVYTTERVYVDHAILGQQTSAGWCVVRREQDGLYLYSSGKTVSATEPLYRYRVDLGDLRAQGRLRLYDQAPVYLDPPHRMEHMQGGTFDPDGTLYLVNGYHGDIDRSKAGIHLFDLEDGRSVGRSGILGRFKYAFRPQLPYAEEPEGITYWDLDADSRAPHISGQLHALLLDNDFPDDDDIYFKHYRVSELQPFGHLYLHHRALAHFPAALSASWAAQLVGVTHDEQSWYLAQPQALWKLSLGNEFPAPEPAEHMRGGALPAALESAGYERFGDLAHASGFVFAPVNGPGVEARLAAFRASDLSYVDSAPLSGQRQARWCGVGALDGLLYSSAATTSASAPVHRYEVDFARLEAEGRLTLTAREGVALRDEDGAEVSLTGITGGSFSAESGHLYLVADGQVWVFNSRGGFVDRSTDELGTETDAGDDAASFGPAPGAPAVVRARHGITVWDMAAANPPGGNEIPGGQVHILGRSSEGALVFEHFAAEAPPFVGNDVSREVHVSHCSWARKLNIERRRPFATLQDALSAGYDGCGHCLRFNSER
ncbi:MAG: hypothetical protein Tsb0020_16770 [Haliangiales bacterium]